MYICKKNRSLSPHLSIYKSQITSLVSIFHRISGCIIGVFLLLVPFMASLIYSFITFRFFFYCLTFLFFYIVYFFYFILSFTLLFHFLNGVRHLLWDFCFGLELNNLFFTGCFVLCFSFFFSFCSIIL